jgi:hypothetical protein
MSIIPTMRDIWFFLLTTIFVATASAVPLSPAARAEIDKLLSRLEVSACEFDRNGNWYKATEAKNHLLNKLKYLEDRGMVQSSEQFIELAASTSNVSGQAYQVKCADGASAPSRSWLLSQLQLLRSATSAVRVP